MSDIDDLLWLGGVYIVLRALHGYQFNVVPALQEKGARAYDAIHDDAGHKQDLPTKVKRWSKKELVKLARDVGFPDPNVAAAIALAESGGVENKQKVDEIERSIGLYQINMNAHKKYSLLELLDPVENANAAYDISNGGENWKPWSVWWADPKHRIGPGQGRFKKFL